MKTEELAEWLDQIPAHASINWKDGQDWGKHRALHVGDKAALAASRLRELDAMLRELEFGDDGYCIICHRLKANDHTGTCPLAALLGGTE